MWWCLHLGGGHLLQLSGGVSTFWSASNTDFKNLSSNFLVGRKLVFSFWSASDTESKKPKCELWMGVTSTLWSASDTDFKNLSSNFMDGGCLCLLISKAHWLQNLSPNLRCDGVSTLAENTFCSICGGPHLLISNWHWLQKPKFQLKMWWCLHLGREHLLELSGGVSTF